MENVIANTENIRPLAPFTGLFWTGRAYRQATVKEWGFSHTFGRWGASVTFESGEELFTYPQTTPPAAPLYKETGATNPRGWLLVRCTRFPQEPTLACPRCGSRDIQCYGAHYKQGYLIPGFDKCTRCGRYAS